MKPDRKVKLSIERDSESSSSDYQWTVCENDEVLAYCSNKKDAQRIAVALRNDKP